VDLHIHCLEAWNETGTGLTFRYNSLARYAIQRQERPLLIPVGRRHLYGGRCPGGGIPLQERIPGGKPHVALRPQLLHSAQ
jgi:hypothetical protein